jgi:hypothetical protein
LTFSKAQLLAIVIWGRIVSRDNFKNKSPSYTKAIKISKTVEN